MKPAFRSITPLIPAAPARSFRNRNAWALWLGKNHGSSPGIWMHLAKKSSGAASVTYAEAIEVALCHGWIDGQKKPFDERYWLQRFTPRTRTSIWSKINREKALALIAGGEMKPRGNRARPARRAMGRGI